MVSLGPKQVFVHFGHIWVSFCRTGNLAVSRHIFSKSRAFVWPNLKRYLWFFNCSWLIVSCRCWKHLRLTLEICFGGFPYLKFWNPQAKRHELSLQVTFKTIFISFTIFTPLTIFISLAVFSHFTIFTVTITIAMAFIVNFHVSHLNSHIVKVHHPCYPLTSSP